CDDDDADVFPGMVELPGDGKSNTCDGSGDGAVDENAGVFVAVDGDPNGAGTRDDPVTIEAAPGARTGFLAAGTDAISTIVAPGPGLIGGFDRTTWTRSRGDRSVLAFGDNAELIVETFESFQVVPFIGISASATPGADNVRAIVTNGPAGAVIVDD